MAVRPSLEHRTAPRPDFFNRHREFSLEDLSYQPLTWASGQAGGASAA